MRKPKATRAAANRVAEQDEREQQGRRRSNSTGAPVIGMPGIAAGEQVGEPRLEQGQLDAEHDRGAERAQRGAGEHPHPAFEQAARAVEQQEGDEEGPEREQQARRPAGRAASAPSAPIR